MQTPRCSRPGRRDRVSVSQAANVVRLLEFFAAHHNPATIAQVARHFGWPRSSTRNLLFTFAGRGYLYQPCGPGAYYPSPLWYFLIGQIDDAGPIPTELHALLQRLSDLTGESAVLLAARARAAVFVATCESSHPLRYVAHRGERYPLQATCGGRALLAMMEPAERRTVLADMVVGRSSVDAGLSSVSALEEDIARSIERGWFHGHTELAPDASAIALPLPLPLQIGRFAIMVVGPTFRLAGRDAEIAAIAKTALENWREN